MCLANASTGQSRFTRANIHSSFFRVTFSCSQNLGAFCLSQTKQQIDLVYVNGAVNWFGGPYETRKNEFTRKTAVKKITELKKTREEERKRKVEAGYRFLWINRQQQQQEEKRKRVWGCLCVYCRKKKKRAAFRLVYPVPAPLSSFSSDDASVDAAGTAPRSTCNITTTRPTHPSTPPPTREKRKKKKQLPVCVCAREESSAQLRGWTWSSWVVVFFLRFFFSFLPSRHVILSPLYVYATAAPLGEL